MIPARACGMPDQIVTSSDHGHSRTRNVGAHESRVNEAVSRGTCVGWVTVSCVDGRCPRR